MISESVPPFELLVAELVKLEKTSELVSSCLSRPFGKEKLIVYWQSINQQSVPEINEIKLLLVFAFSNELLMI